MVTEKTKNLPAIGKRVTHHFCGGSVEGFVIGRCAKGKRIKIRRAVTSKGNPSTFWSSYWTMMG